jgi:hypothetical protein
LRGAFHGIDHPEFSNSEAGVQQGLLIDVVSQGGIGDLDDEKDVLRLELPDLPDRAP